MMLLRAWAVQTRRSVSTYVLIPLIALVVGEAWYRRVDGASRWPDISVTIAESQTLISIVFIGLAAWQGRSEQRSGRRELTSTFDGGRTRHLAVVWMTVVFNAFLGFTISAGLIGWWFGRQTTWGMPDWSLIFAAGASVVAAASLGFAMGMLLPYLPTAPLLAFAWWATDGALTLRDDAMALLPPRALHEVVVTNIHFFPFPSEVAPWQVALWTAIAGLGLIVVLAQSFDLDRPYRVGLVIAGVLLPVVPVAQLLTVELPATSREADLRSVSWACASNLGIEVCLHQANAALLPEVTQTVSALTEPLPEGATLPLKYREFTPQEDPDPDTVTVYVYDRASASEVMAFDLAPLLVTERRFAEGGGLTWCQAVVTTWLMRESGFTIEPWTWLVETPEYALAVTRQDADPLPMFLNSVDTLALMPERERTEWLAQDWNEIIDGSAMCPSE